MYSFVLCMLIVKINFRFRFISYVHWYLLLRFAPREREKGAQKSNNIIIIPLYFFFCQFLWNVFLFRLLALFLSYSISFKITLRVCWISFLSRWSITTKIIIITKKRKFNIYFGTIIILSIIYTGYLGNVNLQKLYEFKYIL